MDNLNSKFAFHWRKNDESLNYSGESINFISLNLSDVGVYTCEVNATSDYLVNGFALGTNTYTLSIRSK